MCFGAATCFALITRFGASTTTLGSDVVASEDVAVLDIAGPLNPHSSGAIDKIATVNFVTKRDENLIAQSSQMRGQPIPSRTGGYHVPMPDTDFASIRI